MAQFTFLGTGTSTGIPEIGCTCHTCTSTDPRDKRLRTSALITDGDSSVLIDPGPDFREQMLRHGVKYLDAIFVTHEHYDHVGGIDDIRPLFRTQEACPVYAEPNVIEALRTRMPYAFGEYRYPGVPDIKLIPIVPGDHIAISPTLSLEVFRVVHGRLPIVGFRVGSLAYITDCKTLPDDSIERIKGVETLVINALRTYPHPAHNSLDEAIELVRAIDPKRTYLIHFAHTFGRHAEIELLMPEGVMPAYDDLTITF